MGICIACGSSKIKKESFKVSKIYDLMKCQSCGLKFIQSPTGEELSIDEYWCDENEVIYKTDSVIKEMHNKHKKYLKKLDIRTSPNKNLLDVGSGAGIFISLAKKYGYSVTGVEPAEKAVKICRDQFAIETKCGLLELNDSLPTDFGVLTSWDVIEHVTDPYTFLEACNNHLVPSGILLLETPNEGCLLRKMIHFVAKISLGLIDLRPRIYYHNHRYYFTKKSIQKLLKRTGFSDVFIYDDRTMFEKEIEKIKMYESPSDGTIRRMKIIFHFIKLIPFTKNKQIIMCSKSKG